jgi:hypothetical protein
MSTVMMQRCSIPEIALASVALVALGIGLYLLLGLFSI